MNNLYHFNHFYIVYSYMLQYIGFPDNLLSMGDVIFFWNNGCFAFILDYNLSISGLGLIKCEFV